MSNRMEYLRKQKERDYSLVKFIGFFIVILFLFMLVTEGGLRWVVSLIILVIVGMMFFKRFHDKTLSVSEWKRENKLEDTVNFQLPATHKLVKKAKGGSEWSRALLEKRIRNEFLKKVKRERNISGDEMKSVLKDKKRIKELLNDDLLSDFIIKSREFYKKVNKDNFNEDVKKDDFNHWVKDSRYESYLKKIINRMEEWN